MKNRPPFKRLPSVAFLALCGLVLSVSGCVQPDFDIHAARRTARLAIHAKWLVKQSRPDVPSVTSMLTRQAEDELLAGFRLNPAVRKEIVRGIRGRLDRTPRSIVVMFY